MRRPPRAGEDRGGADRGAWRCPESLPSPAEKVSSLGKDWHKFCLKCERCGKTLTPGGHAEVSPSAGGGAGGSALSAPWGGACGGTPALTRCPSR